MSGPGATTNIIIDDFLIDCSISENHTFDSDVTDYPVESGSNISDNIRPLPLVVEIEGVVSNTPIGLIADNRRGRTNPDQSPADDAYDLFQRIRDRRKPVTIMTSLRTYNDMALKGLSIPRGENMDAMRFRATFQQIQTVENVRSIRVSVPIAQNGTGKNKKSVTKPGEADETRILLVDFARGYWFDPDVNEWRRKAVLIKAVGGVMEQAGSARVSRKWLLYRDTILPEVKTDRGAQQFGPINSVISVTPNNYHLMDFTIKRKPGEFVDYSPPTGSLTNRTL